MKPVAFICPNCKTKFIAHQYAVIKKTVGCATATYCPSCNAYLEKKASEEHGR